MKRWFVGLCLVVGACSKGPSEDQCKQLLDHLVDLEFKKAGVQATNEQMKGEIAKQKTEVSEKRAPEFVETCKAKLAKSRVECAMAATVIECPEDTKGGGTQKDCGSVADCDK